MSARRSASESPPIQLKRDITHPLLLEELLGPEWVERWARERGKLEALREWRSLRSGQAQLRSYLLVGPIRLREGRRQERTT
jgi:hypothetical protein